MTAVEPTFVLEGVGYPSLIEVRADRGVGCESFERLIKKRLVKKKS